MNKRIKWVSLLVAVLLLIAFIIFQHYTSKSEQAAEVSAPSPTSTARQPLVVDAYVVIPQILSEEITSTGTLLPDEEVNLSFEASGKIVGIYFTEGSKVKKGDLLAKVNDNELQAQMQKLEVQLRLSRSKAYRQQALLAREAVSKEAYDQIVTEVEALEADSALIKARIIQTELRAPFDGFVGLRLTSEGAYASPSTIVSKLTKVSPLKVEFSVPEKYANRMKPGMAVIFQMDGDLKKYYGQVYAVDSKIDVDTRTLLIRARYPNTDEQLLPGRYTGITLKLDEIRHAIAVPAQAIIPELGREKVFLYKNGKVVSQEVNIGLRTSSQVQIVRGLSINDTVVTTGILQLRENLPVQLMNVYTTEEEK